MRQCASSPSVGRARPPPSAPKAQHIDAATRALYVRARHECYAEFAGYRGPAGSNIALPAFESCFKEKTGRYPFQLSHP